MAAPIYGSGHYQDAIGNPFKRNTIAESPTYSYQESATRWKKMALDIPLVTTPANTSQPAAAEHSLSRNKRGVADHEKTWPQHSVLKISLMNMTPEQKTLTKDNINKWAPQTNLFFKFVDGVDGDIRITANNDTSAAWSRVGTDAKNAPASEPTMSIGFDNSPASIAAKIQHEFGHALGLRHEHKHPERTFEFNNEQVYSDYAARKKSRRLANHDILKKFDPGAVTFSAYDEKSIMHYGFSAPALKDGKPLPSNTQLSEGDKTFIQSLYPEDRSFFGKLLNTAIKALVKS